MAEKKRPTRKAAKRPAGAPAVKKAAADKVAAKKVAAKKAAASRRASAPGTGPIVEQLGPRLRAEFEALEKAETKIVRGLANEKTADEFLRDPGAALQRMKVDVPPIIGARLKNPQLLSELVRPRSFQLPNGQVVTARVNVRFTAGDK